MPQQIGDPPQRSGTRVATCPECSNPIDDSARKCAACGARVWSKGQAILLIMCSLPLWAITVGSIRMLGSVDSAAATGFLIGIGLLAPLTTLVGIGKYRDRVESLRGGV